MNPKEDISILLKADTFILRLQKPSSTLTCYRSHDYHLHMAMGIFNLKTWRKSAMKRASSSVIAVFMLQMVAAGFCMPLLAAAPVSAPAMMSHTAHAAEMTHCMTEVKAQQHQHSDVDQTSTHTCAHCDLPDVNISMDKHLFSMDDMGSALLFVTHVAARQSIVVAHFQHLSPPLRTSLFSFDLNQRIRV